MFVAEGGDIISMIVGNKEYYLVEEAEEAVLPLGCWSNNVKRRSLSKWPLCACQWRDKVVGTCNCVCYY